MNWHNRRRSQETDDHFRDSRKHDSLPHRLDRKISTAIDIVMLVRVMDDVEAAAALIDEYAASRASEARMEAVRAGAGA